MDKINGLVSDNLEIFVLFPILLAYKCNNDIYWRVITKYYFEEEVDRKIIGSEFTRKWTDGNYNRTIILSNHTHHTLSRINTSLSYKFPIQPLEYRPETARQRPSWSVVLGGRKRWVIIKTVKVRINYIHRFDFGPINIGNKV